MNLECQTSGGVLIVRVRDSRIDSSNLEGFREEVRAAMPPSVNRLIINLERVEFIDSSGLGAIIALFKRLPADGALALCGVGERIDSLLRVTRLNKLLPIHASEVEALAQLQDMS